MKTMFDNCLTYEQLQVYTANHNKAECARLYKHISSCELCACAINGFASIPFVYDELIGIHQEIDIKTNVKHSYILTLAQACIVFVSLISIFYFYKFADGNSKNKIATFPLKAHIVNFAKSKEKTTIEFSENKIASKSVAARQSKTSMPALSKRKDLSIAQIEALDVPLTETFTFPSEELKPVSPTDVIYIDDLKIADYNKLYFKPSPEKIDLGNYTPSSKENKEAATLFENEANQSIAAIIILKKGLHYFNKNKYTKALEQFQLLLENNPEDINALFYSGIAFYQVGKNNLAIKNLTAVLQYSNAVFYPEAKWHLALTLLKTNKEAAQKMFSEIVDENGFYAKQAKMLMNKM